MMFHWLVDEQRSARSIAVELRRLGIRPQRGEQWAKSSVRNVLTTRFYIGESFFNQREVVANPGTGRKTRHRLRPATEWILLATPAIVTPELFARAQQQLARNRAVLRPPRRAVVSAARAPAVWGVRPSDRGPALARQTMYRCSGRDRLQQPNGGRARASTLSAGWIEPFVWDTLVAILHDPGLLDAKLEAHRTRVGAREVEFRSRPSSSAASSASWTASSGCSIFTTATQAP